MKRLLTILSVILGLSSLHASEPLSFSNSCPNHSTNAIYDYDQENSYQFYGNSDEWEMQDILFNGEEFGIWGWRPRVQLSDSRLYLWFSEEGFPYENTETRYSVTAVPRHVAGKDTLQWPKDINSWLAITDCDKDGYRVIASAAGYNGSRQWIRKTRVGANQYQQTLMVASTHNIYLLEYVEAFDVEPAYFSCNSDFFEYFYFFEDGEQEDNLDDSYDYFYQYYYSHYPTDWKEYTFCCNREIIAIDLPSPDQIDAYPDELNITSYDFEKTYRGCPASYSVVGHLASEWDNWDWKDPLVGELWLGYVWSARLLNYSITFTEEEQVVDALFKGWYDEYCHERVIIRENCIYNLTHDDFQHYPDEDDQRFFDSFKIVEMLQEL